eukprot:434931-Rhodomonas_salina.1
MLNFEVLKALQVALLCSSNLKEKERGFVAVLSGYLVGQSDCPAIGTDSRGEDRHVVLLQVPEAISNDSEEEQGQDSEDAYHGWGDGLGAAVPNLIPDELSKRFMGRIEGRQAAHCAIESFCHATCKSCKLVPSNSNTLILVCPFRTDPDAVKGTWKSKRQINRPDDAELGQEKEDIQVSDKGGTQEEEEGWMINDHPEFLANMLKSKNDRTSRPGMVKVLASGRGGSVKLNVTAKQVEYAEGRSVTYGPMYPVGA